MPDLLTLETADWALQVWSRDVSASAERLSATLASRGKPLPPARLAFKPALLLAATENSIDSLTLEQPVFFENKQYEFEFIFSPGIESPAIRHRLKTIEDGFHSKDRSLRGFVNTGNDIGWFRLRLQYKKNGIAVEQTISFEVLPTKMDMEEDLQCILRVVDQTYPLWRFSLAQKTDYEMSQSYKPHERFPLLWLAHFTALRQQFEQAVKQVINAPHTRLLPHVKSLTADRLKGRISYRLEGQIEEDLASGEHHRRYAINTRRLSIDTPENRFVKMALQSCVKMLSHINRLAQDQETLSRLFSDELEAWKKPLEQYLARPFFKDIGPYSGLSRESLVLHQKAGYAGVYRIWQQLKLYLDVFGRHAAISMKSVAELYEVWCLLEIREILLELGFVEISASKPDLLGRGLDKSLKDGIGAAFRFKRENVTLRLAHEPMFSRPDRRPEGKIYSWITTQKPDILIEARFEDGTEIHWIFDAKYRIAEDRDSRKENAEDQAPDDAINQMHRYRDALIHAYRHDDGVIKKSRPVLGAYVLYPGWFDETSRDNPYQDAIDEVGIGAFPLLPGRQNLWLRQFLASRFPQSQGQSSYRIDSPDRYYIEEPVRIPSRGMTARHFNDLTLMVSTANPKTRTNEYLAALHEGRLEWFHLKHWAVERSSIEHAVMGEIRYCAIAELNETSGNREVRYVYDVLQSDLVKRSDISQSMSGLSGEPDNPEEKYWLLKLGASRKITNPIVNPGSDDHHYMKFVSEQDLHKNYFWDDLPVRYQSSIKVNPLSGFIDR